MASSLRYLLFSIFLLTANFALADVADQFRKDNAVALYEFADADNLIRDTADPKWGPALNLEILPIGDVQRISGGIDIRSTSQIRSQVPAQKIFNNCRPKNEMSVEVWLQNNENSEQRIGEDDAQTLQPLRIVTYSRGLKSRNFTIGQTYDGGNMYANAVTNTSNAGLSLREPAFSSTDSIFIPGAEPTQPQKLIFTFKNGQARLYLSDRNGQMYLHTTKSADFTGNLDNWDNGAYLVLGNEYITNNSVYNLGTNFKSCNPAQNSTCATNPNRFWKGRLTKVAIYCKELTKLEIFGSQFQTIQNPIFPIDPALQITPMLRRAQAIYTRISGVSTPIYNPALKQMADKLNLNDGVGAAEIATQDPNFFNITVKDFASKMSNREEINTVPLNDFIATIAGFVRDRLDAKRLLYENIVYVADPTKAAVPSSVEMDMVKSNNHYAALSSDHFDLSKVLIPSTQKVFNGASVVDNPTPAGLLTSRQWLASHAIAGTNRRLVEYTFRQFLCLPLEKVADSTGPDNVVGRDIDRFPGGSHSKFITTCRACHTVMDGFRPAFAHFTFSNNIVKHSMLVGAAANADEEMATTRMEQMPLYVAKKMNHNDSVFPEGMQVTSDNWVNNARFGSNASTFNWDRTSGKGVQQFGQMIANSKQFPICMTKRVFASVCRREPASSDQSVISEIATEFSTLQNSDLRWLFQRVVTAPECLGEVGQ